jgi:hypothetical protein
MARRQIIRDVVAKDLELTRAYSTMHKGQLKEQTIITAQHVIVTSITVNEPVVEIVDPVLEPTKEEIILEEKSEKKIPFKKKIKDLKNNGPEVE